LSDGKAIEAIMAKVLKEGDPKQSRGTIETTDEGRSLGLAMQAEVLGLTPEEIDRAIREWGRKTEDRYLQGLAALYEKNYQTATRLLTQTYEKRKDSGQQDGADLADAAFFLGQSLYGRHKYGAAADKFQEAALLREDDPYVLNWLGISLHQITEYAEAEPLLERALKIREKELGENHPSTSTSLINLAMLYYAEQKPAEAEPLLERALEIREKSLGKGNPSLAATLQELAAVYQSRGKYGEAESCLRRAIDIQEKALGVDHPAIARSLEELGRFFSTSGFFQESEPFYRRSLEIREQKLGKDHPDTIGSFLAVLVSSLIKNPQRFEEFEARCRNELDESEKKWGPDHPKTAANLITLAELYFLWQRYEDAEPLFRRALVIREKAQGQETIIHILMRLARIYNEENKPELVEPLYRRVLEIKEQTLGKDHPSIAESLHLLAERCESRGEYGEAEALYLRALEIDEQALGKKNSSKSHLRERLEQLNTKRSIR
jgi:tetratricopeptide (TPR) repeat protein